jgi:hypothetical protein
VVSVSGNKRASASRSLYDELDPETFERREGVHRIRDDGCDGWDDKLPIILSPSHDCHQGELAREFVERLEEQLGHSVQWSAWSHRDQQHPHVHVVVCDPREVRNDRSFAQLASAVERATAAAWQTVRDRQRGYAQERDRAGEFRARVSIGRSGCQVTVHHTPGTSLDVHDFAGMLARMLESWSRRSFDRLEVQIDGVMSAVKLDIEAQRLRLGREFVQTAVDHVVRGMIRERSTGIER